MFLYSAEDASQYLPDIHIPIAGRQDAALHTEQADNKACQRQTFHFHCICTPFLFIIYFRFQTHQRFFQRLDLRPLFCVLGLLRRYLLRHGRLTSA